MAIFNFVAIPIKSHDSLRTDNEIDTVIIAKKVVISVTELEMIIKILTTAKEQL